MGTPTNLAGMSGVNTPDEDVVVPEMTVELNRLILLKRSYTAPTADELMPRGSVYSQRTNERLDDRLVAEGCERELAMLCSQDALVVIPRTAPTFRHQDGPWQICRQHEERSSET